MTKKSSNPTSSPYLIRIHLGARNGFIINEFHPRKKINLKRLIKYGRFFFCGFLVPFRSFIYDTSKHKYRSCAFHIAKQQKKLSWDFTFSLFRCYLCVFKIVSISFLKGKRQLHRDRSEKKTHTFICHLIISVVIQCQYLYYKPNVIWIEPEFVRFAMENESTLGSITTIGSNDWWFYRPLYIK